MQFASISKNYDGVAHRVLKKSVPGFGHANHSFWSHLPIRVSANQKNGSVTSVSLVTRPSLVRNGNMGCTTEDLSGNYVGMPATLYTKSWQLDNQRDAIVGWPIHFVRRLGSMSSGIKPSP